MAAIYLNIDDDKIGENGTESKEGLSSPSTNEIASTIYSSSADSSKNDLNNFQSLPKLIARSQKLLNSKDFHAEIRGQMDVENYLGNYCSVLIDVEETELEKILLQMIEEKPTRFFFLDGKRKFPKGKLRIEQIASNSHQYIPFGNIRQKIFTQIGGEYFGRNALKEYLQSIWTNGHESILVDDESWFGLYCSIEEISNPRIAFARLHAPTNFGRGLSEVRFILLVIAPFKQKETKSALEIARTFGTILADPILRNDLANAENETQFIGTIREKAKQLAATTNANQTAAEGENRSTELAANNNKWPKWFPGRGLIINLHRRLPHYKSDYFDGISDAKTLQKTISTAIFLFFIILPSAIALGMLNEENTHERINVKKVILGQWIAGILFGIFGGQLFLVVLTSPPITIYIKVIDRIAESSGFNFFQLYSGIGIWCCFYLFLFAVFEASNVMMYAKRSLEELFSLFIASTLTIEAINATFRMLHRAFLPHCLVEGALPVPPTIHPPPPPPPHPHGILFPHLPPHLDPLNCNRSVGILFILLMLGTTWLALTLSNFRKTAFLGKGKREIISDYALPLAVCAMTLVTNFMFQDVPQETFNLDESTPSHTLGPFWLLPFKGQLICCLLGFPLAILLAMDQMIVTNTVDNSQNNLKKGPAANWDILVVSLINIPLSLFCLPWVHASLPQSFLHLKAYADVEDQLLNGTVQPVIVKNRESRLAILLAHLLMIPTYFFALPILRYFPTCLFHGVFLFLAYSNTIGNEFFQRLLLIFTEQRSYPPTHYIRRVPQRIVHLFTSIEFLQFALLLGIGHFPWPIIRLIFPLALIIFIPLRALLFPLIFDKRHLEVLDGIH